MENHGGQINVCYKMHNIILKHGVFVQMNWTRKDKMLGMTGSAPSAAVSTSVTLEGLEVSTLVSGLAHSHSWADRHVHYWLNRLWRECLCYKRR